MMHFQKSFYKIISLFILLLSAACGVLTPVEPTPTIIPTPAVTGIKGRVYYASTDKPLMDATVLINTPKLGEKQNPDLTIAETKTDSQGNYEFKDIKPGEYVVSLQFTTETPIKNIDFTKNTSQMLNSFNGRSTDGKTLLYILEPKVVVEQGEMVQEDFVIQ